MTNKRQPTLSELRAVVEDLLQSPEGPEKVFGSRVQHMRKQWGYSQEELARVMQEAGFKWQQTTVAKTETGKRPVRLNEAYALATHFGVTVDDLISLDLLGDEEFGEGMHAFRVAVSMAAAGKLRFEALMAHRDAVDAELQEVARQVAVGLTAVTTNGRELTDAIRRLLPDWDDEDEEEKDGEE